MMNEGVIEAEAGVAVRCLGFLVQCAMLLIFQEN